MNITRAKKQWIWKALYTIYTCLICVVATAALFAIAVAAQTPF